MLTLICWTNSSWHFTSARLLLAWSKSHDIGQLEQEKFRCSAPLHRGRERGWDSCQVDKQKRMCVCVCARACLSAFVHATCACICLRVCLLARVHACVCVLNWLYECKDGNKDSKSNLFRPRLAQRCSENLFIFPRSKKWLELVSIPQGNIVGTSYYFPEMW